MQNINPSRSLARRARYYLFIGLVSFFAGAIAITLSVLFIFFPLWDTAAFTLCQGTLFLIGLAFLGIGVAGILRTFTLQKDNPLAYAVGEGLGQFLDNRYTYLRNVSKRGVGYVDAVLIGPPGLLVFRIVDYTGYWRNERVDWRVPTRDGKELRTAKTNPSRECVRDVYALRKFLGKHGLTNVPIYAIVVFASPNVKLEAQGPVVPICEIPTLYQIMKRDYLLDERVAPPAVRQTVDLILD